MVKRSRQNVKASAAEVSPVAVDDRRTQYICLAILMIAASVLILMNLGDCYLWGDEAQTALVSRTILTHGIPMGTDGKNFFSVLFGAEYGTNYVWRFHPWLPFYTVALFFKLFGISTLTARLPFALLGVLSVGVAYLFGRALWNSNRAGILSAILLMTSVPMLLLVRQCRYYEMTTFFCLVGLYAYHQMMQGRKHSATVFFAAAFLLLHSLHIYLAPLLGTAIIHSFIFHRDRLKQVFILSSAVIVLNIPWLIFFSGITNKYIYRGSMLTRVLGELRYLLQQTALHMLPSWPVLVVLVIILVILQRMGKMRWKEVATANSLSLVGLFIVLTIVVLSFTARPYFRYIAPMIPVMCLLIGLLIDTAMKLNPVVGLAAVAVIAYQGRILDYGYELTHDFYGPIEGTVQYLNNHGKPSDVVAVHHDALPIMFYTKMTVISGVTGQSFEPGKNADWIVMRRNVLTGLESKFVDYMEKNCDMSKYVMIELDAPSTLEQNRESPEEHYFRTQTDAPKVLLFKRIKTSK